MSFLVTCTFDLKNGSAEDYENAYVSLEAIGLKKVVVGDKGKFVIPTTTVAAEIAGSDAKAVVGRISNEVQAAFRAKELKYELFITVGGNWAWSAAKET